MVANVGTGLNGTGGALSWLFELTNTKSGLFIFWTFSATILTEVYWMLEYFYSQSRVSSSYSWLLLHKVQFKCLMFYCTREVFVIWSHNSVIKTWRILGGNSSCAMPLCHLNCKNELKLQLTSWRIQIVKSFINCKKSTPSSYFTIFNTFFN